MRQQKAAENVGQADKDGADKRALDRADAADHDHHEGEDQNGFAHAHLHRLDRADQRACKTCKCSAKGEDQRV